eukprot:5835343-Prymnesium_polylepis.1
MAVQRVRGAIREESHTRCTANLRIWHATDRAPARRVCCAQAEQIGFAYVASGPMVRSSYKAGEFFMAAMVDETNTQSSE